MRAFVLRKRKVDAAVVEGVLAELLQTPLAGPTEIGAPRQCAVEPPGSDRSEYRGRVRAESPASPCCGRCGGSWRSAHVHVSGGVRCWVRCWRACSLPAAPPARLERAQPPIAGCGSPDPTALAALVTPDLPLAQVPGSLCWLTFLMTLFYWNVPLSVLGRWCGVHQDDRSYAGSWGWRWPYGRVVAPMDRGARQSADGLCG